MLTITGHRGAPDEAPENTLTSFKKAIEIGVDYIELDVRMTRDNQLVVIHDETVDRTTNGTGNVSSYTLNELKELDAGSWFSKEFRGEKIPTLREALELIDNNCIVEIELKEDNLEEKVGLLLEELGMTGNVIVSSFNKQRIYKFKTIFKKVPTVLITGRYYDNLMADALGSLANRVDVGFESLSRDTVKYLHLRCLFVNGWIVDTLPQLEKSIELKVDNITTNHPRMIINYFKNNF
ncbi:MAG: glycerophosphodiester phosphodiesterase [Thermofilum sp. ex4484_79]|nr:MAG: glycerophosphodiester phosphodiesterase [Thermofilum sp. ex4484_79]